MEKQERLSVLMDGELVDGQVIDGTLCDRLLHDNDLQQQWQRYHLIRDTLQGNLSCDLPVDFVVRVAHTLQEDRQQASPAISAGLAACRASWQRWKTVCVASMNQLGEISLAAGVAVLLLCGALWYQGDSVTVSHHHAAVNPLPLGGETLPVSYALSSQQQALRQQLLNDKVKDYAKLRLQRPAVHPAFQKSSEPHR